MIIDFLRTFTGSADNKIQCDLEVSEKRSIHDMHTRCYKICLPYFKQCSLQSQRQLEDDKLEKAVKMIRDRDVQVAVATRLTKIGQFDSMQAWDIIEEELDIAKAKAQKQWLSGKVEVFDQNEQRHKQRTMTGEDRSRIWQDDKHPLCYEANKMEIVFSYVYPRLDVEVSKHMNHLLKSPFVIHPKTGKVCVPLDPETLDHFDPNASAPTLRTLEKELNDYHAKCQQENIAPSAIGYKNAPSMVAAVAVFEKTFLNHIEGWRREVNAASGKAMTTDMEDIL